MISASCPLCKSTSRRTKFRLRTHRIDECAGCGFWYNATFRGGGHDGGMFSESYYRDVHHEAFHDQFEDYRHDPSAKPFRRWLEWIERHIPVGRVLDVGSALGTFLRIARDRGWEPQGVEISRFAADYTRKVHGIAVFNGDLNDFDAPRDSFDLITFWDSFEHLTWPADNLCKARSLLRPGGLLLIATDDFDSLIGDVARLTHWASLGRFQYPIQRLFIDRNRSYFTRRNLVNLLESKGLQVLVTRKMEYPLSKIRTAWPESLILRLFYAMAFLIHRQAQVTVLAQKQ